MMAINEKINDELVHKRAVDWLEGRSLQSGPREKEQSESNKLMLTLLKWCDKP